MSRIGDDIELAVNIARVPCQVPTALEDQVKLAGVLHLTVEAFAERSTFKQVSIRADGHGHILIILAHGAHMIHELHLVELGPIGIARVGEDGEVVDQDEHVVLLAPTVERYLFLQFCCEGAKIVMAHHI